MVNLLMSLPGTESGQDQETITNRSVLEYGSPIWDPSLNLTKWQLQATYSKVKHKFCLLRVHSTIISKQYQLLGQPGRNQFGRPPSPKTYNPKVYRRNWQHSVTIWGTWHSLLQTSYQKDSHKHCWTHPGVLIQKQGTQLRPPPLHTSPGCDHPSAPVNSLPTQIW